LSLGNGDLVIYDAASRKEFKRVKIGHGATGILMDRDGNRAFIACGPDNYVYVAVLDLKTLAVTGHIDVGGEPDGLACSSYSTRSQQVLRTTSIVQRSRSSGETIDRVGDEISQRESTNGFGSNLSLQSGINWLALQSQNTEDAFVRSAQRFLSNEAF
jgi:hypothetical protein